MGAPPTRRRRRFVPLDERGKIVHGIWSRHGEVIDALATVTWWTWDRWR